MHLRRPLISRFSKAIASDWSLTLQTLVLQDSALDMLQSQQAKAAGGWMDTILNLIPGRKQQSADEPNEEAIKRTHEYLRYPHSAQAVCCSLKPYKVA